MPDVKSRRITRDKLHQALKNHELVKFLENLAEDVIETLPTSASDAEARLDAIESLPSFAAAAQAIADAAMKLALALSEGPPCVPATAQPEQEDLTAQVCGLREQVAALSARVSDLESVPTS